MTVRQLKRSMDARFKWVDSRFRRVDSRFRQMDASFRQVDARFDRVEDQIRETEERLKRHISVMVESIHDDMRMFAEAIGLNSERLDDHETRLRGLEQRRPT
jgi:DNA anti-recombination protein RmuC